MQMATLSLYIFNLLPIKGLDGHAFLDDILDFSFPSTSGMSSYDDETLEIGAVNTSSRTLIGGRTGTMKGRIRVLVSTAAIGLGVACLGLGLIEWVMVK